MRLSKLHDICSEIQYGYTQSSSTENIGPKFLRITDIQDNKVNWETTPYCEITLKDLEKYKLSTGDIVVARTGATTGKSFLIKSPPTAVFASYLIKLSVNKELALPDYIWWFMQSPSYWNHITVSSNGTTQPGVNAKVLSELAIPLPSLEEQIQIAKILNKGQALIDKRKEAIARLDELVQAVFLDMFGDPKTNSKNLETIPLSKLGEWKSGGTPSRGNQEYFKGNIPWYTSGELNDLYITESNEYISEAALKETSTKEVTIGSLLLGMYDTAALKSSITTKRSSCNQAIAFAKINEHFAETKYVYHAIQMGKEHYKSTQRGVRQKNLNLSMIKEIEILYPSLELQIKFVRIFDNIYSNKKQMKLQLQQLESNFQALLQKAFKGELKVKDGVAV